MRLRNPNRASSALLLFALITLFVGGANYAALVWSQSRIIEHEALRVAEVVNSQALASRSVFATQVAEKIQRDGFGISEHFHELEGYVPIPAQYLKFVAQEVRESNQGLYDYKPLSKWNLAPDQGLQDDFQRWAWAQLEQQDKPDPDGPIDWQPVWRFEPINGVRTLRYMSADAADSESCVQCHSAREQRPDIIARRQAAGIPPGKEWKQHQLLGALEIRVPVNQMEAMAASQANLTLAVILTVSLGGLVTAALLAWRGIVREREASAYFEQQAMGDSLTGLLNRSGLEESTRALIDKARATGAGVCVLFIDLDGFKPVNDSFGHRVGDEILKQVADRIHQVVRESDLVARYGGDEFLVVLENSAGSAHHQKAAQSLLRILSQAYWVDDHQINLSASIGVSCFPMHGHSLRDLIRKADQAMYAAKDQGRSQFVVYSAEE